MEDQEFPVNEIEWNNLFTDVVYSWPSPKEVTVSNPSPDDSVTDWVAEIESMLLKDDDNGEVFEPSQPFLDDFFSDILIDSPIFADDLEFDQQLLENFFSDAPTDKNPKVSDESVPVRPDEVKISYECAPVRPEDSPVEVKVMDGPEEVKAMDGPEDSPEEVKAMDGPEDSPEEVKVLDVPEANSNNDDGENHTKNEENDESGNNDDADDPVSKKRRRLLRNRDAAVRSRERKKMYVKDLEIKSSYLEAECRRLGRLLQCVLSENQALHFSLQKGNALGASSAKQESAVLLLESLLLGSLLWFLGIMCLFTVPQLTLSNLESAPLVHVEEKAPGNLALRGAGSNHLTLSLSSSRRCKASRTKMKFFSRVLIV